MIEKAEKLDTLERELEEAKHDLKTYSRMWHEKNDFAHHAGYTFSEIVDNIRKMEERIEQLEELIYNYQIQIEGDV